MIDGVNHLPAPLTIIIPTLNAADTIGPCIAALTEGLQEGLIRELIFSDGGSTDEIALIADEAGAVLVTGAPGRGGQLGRATMAAKGRWFLFLHADTVLQPGWTGPVLDHLQNHPQQAGYFDLQFATSGSKAWLVAGWANLRSRLFRLPYGDQGLLISAQTYNSAGGYRDIPLMEDVAIARRLGRGLRPLHHPAKTSASRYISEGWLRRGWLNLTTLVLYLFGRDPEGLAGRYNRI